MRCVLQTSREFFKLESALKKTQEINKKLDKPLPIILQLFDIIYWY
jgi:hypothetical protein